MFTETGGQYGYFKGFDWDNGRGIRNRRRVGLIRICLRFEFFGGDEAGGGGLSGHDRRGEPYREMGQRKITCL